MIGLPYSSASLLNGLPNSLGCLLHCLPADRTAMLYCLPADRAACSTACLLIGLPYSSACLLIGLPYSSACLGNIVFNLFAMHADAILYAVLSNNIGRQFLMYSLDFSAFGTHVIVPCL